MGLGSSLTPKRASLLSAEKSPDHRGGHPWSRSQCISMHHCSNQKALFSDASAPCTLVIFPLHHNQSFPLVQKVLSLTHLSSFVASPKPTEAQAEEQGRMWKRVLRGTPDQNTIGMTVVNPIPASSWSTYLPVKPHLSAKGADSFMAAV